MTVTEIERVGDHAVKWLGLLVSVLLLITLWQSYRLNSQKLKAGGA